MEEVLEAEEFSVDSRSTVDSSSDRDCVMPNSQCGICGRNNLASVNIKHNVPLYQEDTQATDTESCELSVLECPACHTYTQLLYKGKWNEIDSVLKSCDSNKNGSHKVVSTNDAVRLWLLSQVCYNQVDVDTSQGESPFTIYARDEYAKLMWHHGSAIGFYTLKLKGCTYSGNALEAYSMTMLDTIYIRKPWRRKGFGLQLLEDLFSDFPGEDIGVSKPVSEPLLNGLQKLLIHRKDLRDRIWLCTYTGEEGYKESAWFHLKMRQKPGV